MIPRGRNWCAAVALSDQERHALALSAARRAKEQAPDELEPLLYQAMILQRLGTVSQERAVLQTLLGEIRQQSELEAKRPLDLDSPEEFRLPAPAHPALRADPARTPRARPRGPSMKAVVQRVQRAEVRVDGDSVGRIDAGMLVLLGVMRGDGEREAEKLAERVARFRFFSDEEGRMNLSVLDTGGAVLVVSQVTLAADGRKGRRPSLDAAALPADAEALYLVFVERMRALGLRCETGAFGAMMAVELVNDGPVTFVLEEPLPARREAP